MQTLVTLLKELSLWHPASCRSNRYPELFMCDTQTLRPTLNLVMWCLWASGYTRSLSDYYYKSLIPVLGLRIRCGI